MREAANGMTNGFKHSWSSQVISAFGKSFNAKFAREFLKARVVKGVGINALELENLHGLASRSSPTGSYTCLKKEIKLV